MAERKDPRLHLDRRSFVKAALSSAAVASTGSLALVAPSRAAERKYVFKMAHSEAIGSPITDSFEEWGKVLRERSGGRIDAQHFPAGQLGNYTNLIEGSRIGTIQATAGGTDTEEAIAPEIAVTGLGFIFTNEPHVDKVLQGPLGKDFSDICRAKTGVELVDYAEVGFRHLLAKRKVTVREELRGLKIRVPELKVWVDFWRKLGANPTPLAYAEQYSALSTGVIDGLEADFFSIKGFKWHEQAKHMTLIYHWFLAKAVRVNARWLDGLPEDLRKLVRDSAKEVFARQRSVNRAKTSQALEELKALGVQVYTASDMEQWRASTASLYEEYGTKYPAARPVIAKILALR